MNNIKQAQAAFDAAETISDAAYAAMRSANNNGTAVEYAAAVKADLLAEEIYNEAEAALDAAKVAT